MRQRSTLAAALAFTVAACALNLVDGDAHAGWPARVIERGRLEVARFTHNRRVDPDERLSRDEFARFKSSGQIPARVAPAAVLQRKLGRARAELAAMRSSVKRTLAAASGVDAYDAAVWSENALCALNSGTARLFEAIRYGETRSIAVPSSVGSLARSALRQLDAMDAGMKRARLTYGELYWGRTHPDPYAVASREGNRQALGRLAGSLR